MLSTPDASAVFEEWMADSVVECGLAEMSLSSLLYYVLFGEWRLVDETG